MKLTVGAVIVPTSYRADRFTKLDQPEAALSQFASWWPLGEPIQVTEANDVDDEPEWGFDWRYAELDEEAAWRLKSG